MKAIPEQLRAYFPKVINADRPWWNRESVPMGFFVGTQWSRPDGYETTNISEREEIDKANPLPPPPILVGQVWAMPYDGGFRVGTIVAVEHFDHGGIRADWSNTWYNSTDRGLHIDGFLLSCPYGYAPWSGPEVP